MAYRRRRFGRGPFQPPPIVEMQKAPKKRQRCSGCSSFIAAGETALRFMLRSQFRLPCTSCGNAPKRSRWYHTACRPGDINKAMGFNPATATNAPPPASAQRGVAPPPKPKTHTDLELEALAALEAAVVARARAKGVTPEMEAAFKQFQGIKSRVLRPGTPAEGEVATSIALQKIVKLVFA